LARATGAAPIVAPAKPTGLAGSVSEQTVTLSWTPDSNAVTYTVQHMKMPTGKTLATLVESDWNNAVTVTGIAGQERAITGLDYATEYVFRVMAVNTAGASPYSDALARATGAAPIVAHLDMPANFVVTSGRSLELAWDAVKGADGYVVQYRIAPLVSAIGGKNNNGGAWHDYAIEGNTIDGNAVDGNRVTIAIPNLVHGVNYMFRVYAMVDNNTVDYGIVTSETTQAQIGRMGDPIVTAVARKLTGIKAGKSGSPDAATINTVTLTGLSIGATEANTLITFDKLPNSGKLPKGVMAMTELEDVRIVINGGKAVISGLPAGKTFRFVVQYVSPQGELTRPITVRAATAKLAADTFGNRSNTGPLGIVFTPKQRPAATAALLGAGCTSSYYEITVWNRTSAFSAESSATFVIPRDSLDGDSNSALLNGKEVTAMWIDGNIAITGLESGTRYTLAVQITAQDDKGFGRSSSIAKFSIRTARVP
jgi:hypothetical protein